MLKLITLVGRFVSVFSMCREYAGRQKIAVSGSLFEIGKPRSVSTVEVPQA